MYTLDTNAIIYCINKEKEVNDLIKSALFLYSPVYVSIISLSELTSLPTLKKEEILLLENFLNPFNIIVVDLSIAKIAARIRRSNKFIKLPDAIIAATAIFTGTTLITRNIKDFSKIKELKIKAI